MSESQLTQQNKKEKVTCIFLVEAEWRSNSKHISIVSTFSNQYSQFYNPKKEFINNQELKKNLIVSLNKNGDGGWYVITAWSYYVWVGGRETRSRLVATGPPWPNSIYSELYDFWGFYDRDQCSMVAFVPHR